MIVKILSEGKWGSFNVQIEGGSKKYMTPSKKMTTPLQLGGTYDVESFKPDGKKTTYITKATVINEGTEPAPDVEKPVETETKKEAKPTKEYWEKKDAKNHDGLARGNYRTNVTNYLIACIQKDAKEDLDWFNECLKYGEAKYFGDALPNTPEVKKDEKPVTDPYKNF